MTGYGIHELAHAIGLVAAICLIPLAGFLVTGLRRLATARFVAWTLALAAVSLVALASRSEPHGTRMLLIIVALMWSMKAVVYVETRHHRRCDLTFWQWLAFCVGWFGMRADALKTVPGKPLHDWTRFILRGSIRILAGCAMVFAAWMVAHPNANQTDVETWRRWTATALLLPGLSLIVHFGLFNLLTGFWRSLGGRCTALFRAPLSSQSLNEFWSRRWNLAFSEMTAIAVYRPIKKTFGSAQQASALATMGGFIFSGVLHELAISVPVGAGYGLPLLYFAINGIGTMIEPRISVLNNLGIARVWTASWVLIPLPILFHPPFMEGCVWPIIGI